MAGVKRVGMLFLACAICLAIWKSIPHDSAGLIDWSDTKVDQSENVIEGGMEKLKDKVGDIPKPESIIPDSPKKTSDPK